MLATRARVLIVDDNPQILRFIELCLRSHDYQVVTAGSGAEGLEILASGSLDIILLDIRMPDMDGFQFMARAAEVGQWPVIAYSASPEYAAQAIEAGAVAFLSKPLDLNHLTGMLDEFAAARA